MSSLPDGGIESYISALAERYPKRALVLPRLIKLASQNDAEVDRAGMSYLSVSFPTKMDNIKLLHITNTGKITLLYYFVDKLPEGEMTRYEFRALMKAAGLSVKPIMPKNQETLDMPNSESGWDLLGEAFHKLSLRLVS